MSEIIMNFVLILQIILVESNIDIHDTPIQIYFVM